MRKNKKIIYTIMIAISILLFILLALNLTKKEHEVKYEVNNYNIEEKYKDNHYIIKISKEKNSYVYVLNNTMNKKRKIIKDITSVNGNDLECIIPKYKKNLSPEIYCQLDGKQVSINYLIDTENIDFQEMKSKLKKNNITIPNTKEKQITYKKLSLFPNNFDKEKIVVWDYKGIYIVGNDKNNYQKILKKDLYDNIMSTIVDKYFVLLDNSSVNGIENVYYYDLSRNKLKNFKLKNKLSKKSYINGVVDNLIYITDKEKKKEYTLDIKHQKLVEVDKNQTEFIIYKNNEKKILNKSDFLMEEQYFDNSKIEKENIDADEIRENNEYYYYTKNGDYYKAIKGYEEYPTLIFHSFDIKEWFIINDNIYFTKQDTIYKYSEEKGLKKLVQYNELRYNYKNIYKVWEN